jgi:hypothetical protein
MNRNKGQFRSVPSSLTNAAWCGIFGPYAGWLTESTALIDRERLKRRFAAYWGLYSPVGIACSRLPPGEQAQVKVQQRRLAELGVRGSRPSMSRPTDSESPLHPRSDSSQITAAMRRPIRVRAALAVCSPHCHSWRRAPRPITSLDD